MDNPHQSELTRRRFLTLLAGSAAALALASCGDEEPLDIGLIGLFSPDNMIVAGREQRLTFALVGEDIDQVDDLAPIKVRVLDGGAVISELSTPGLLVHHGHLDGEADTAHQHPQLLRYYAPRVTFPVPGVYDLEAAINGATVSFPVQAFDEATVGVLAVGRPFPVIRTPTEFDPLGVDPICSRAPDPCGFHEDTPEQLLATGVPFVVLVSTPAYCSTSYCGPVLETLVDRKSSWPDLPFIHVEVYANAKESGGDPNDPSVDFAPIIDQLGLDVEPALFVVDANGVVIERLDNVFGRVEFDAAVTQVF